jgi:predicted extracellular nuclease
MEGVVSQEDGKQDDVPKTSDGIFVATMAACSDQSVEEELVGIRCGGHRE